MATFVATAPVPTATISATEDTAASPAGSTSLTPFDTATGLRRQTEPPLPAVTSAVAREPTLASPAALATLATLAVKPGQHSTGDPTVEPDGRRPAPRERVPATATQTPTPAPTPDGAARSLTVPILMFHYVSEPPPGADAIRTSNSVTPALFDSFLRYLKDAGFHTVSLDDLLYALVQGRALPPKPVVLTFDDGYEDNFTNAFPILQRYQMTGTFFLITDFVNQNAPGYMTWDQIKTMSDAGQRFGSHTRNHPDLRGKSVDYLVWEALGGTEAIQEHLGYHPRWIAYPSGGYDDQAIAVFKSANYWGGVTTEFGATHSSRDLFTLTRIRIFGYYSSADLAKLLSAGE